MLFIRINFVNFPKCIYNKKRKKKLSSYSGKQSRHGEILTQKSKQLKNN